MAFLTLRRRDGVHTTRNHRELRPDVEGFERRQLLSGGTISGTTFQDLAGNGTFTDVSRLAGVTVDLYQKGSKAVFEHATTDKNGNFSFSNLAPGSYTVQQAVPSKFLPTGALDGYPVTLASGQNAPGKDFEDFQLNPLPTLTNLSYSVTPPGGKPRTFSSLGGNVQQGDTVTAKFSVSSPTTLTLVAYKAPNGDFDTSNLQQQVIFSQATSTGAGTETLKVTVPDGYFQIDFVAGLAIGHLDTNLNVLYHAQDRYIDGQQGGTQSNTPAVTSSVAASSNNTLSTSGSPVGMFTIDSADVAAPDLVQARKH